MPVHTLLCYHLCVINYHVLIYVLVDFAHGILTCLMIFDTLYLCAIGEASHKC